MGLRALFGMDPEADLAKGERLLAGDPVRALELATRAARSDREELRVRAQALAASARGRILDNVLARAAEAEADGALEQAASWLEAALVHETVPERRAELEARRAALLDHLDEERNPFGREGGADRHGGRRDETADAAGGGDPGEDLDADLDARYETLVAMLAEEVAPGWEGRPHEVRAALVALNEGDVATALPALEELAGAAPDDPVLRLERGRVRRLAGDVAGAREDFVFARGVFGDGPLDATDTLSVPGLLAEAEHAGGDPAAAAALLRDLADPRDGRVELCHLHGAALVAARDAEALDYAERAAAHFPRDPRFAVLLGAARVQAGDAAGAIACLEAAVARRPAPRGQDGSHAHPPALRALAELHLDHGGDAERAAELMARLAHQQGGMLGPDDHVILARYYRRRGDDEVAAWCEAEAARLRESGEELSAPPPALGGGRQRVL